MTYVWLIFGFLSLLVGAIGCFLPILPGPVLAYAGLWFLCLTPYSLSFSTLLWTGAALAAVLLLDFFGSSFGTKKFGGSGWGVFGCVVGTLVGLFFSPLGLVLGPFLGAFGGELIAGKRSGLALKAAFGAFLGFLFGSLLKFVLCVFYGWLFIAAVLEKT